MHYLKFKYSLLCFILLSVTFPSAAENSLVLNFKDGSNMYFSLADCGDITLDNDILAVSANDSDRTFAIEDVAGFRYSGLSSAETSESIGTVTVRIIGSHIEVTGDGPLSLTLSDMHGRFVKSEHTHDNARVDISGLSGLYILTINNISHKIRL